MKRRWSNYLGNQRCRAELRAPASLVALSRTVRRAARRGRVRAVGNSYSWSALVPTSGTMISLRRLTRCLEVDAMSETPSIRVECGMSVREAEAHARAAGLVLRSPTMFDRVSVGGALATGSHGADLESGCFSDSILSATLVTADGSVLEVSGGEELDALRVGLGALGILYAVRLRCQRAFAVFSEERWLDLEPTLEELPALARSVRFAQLWYFPFVNRIGFKGMYTLDAPSPTRSRGARAARWLRDQAAVIGGTTVMPALVRAAPRLLPSVIRSGGAIAVTPGARVSSAWHEFHFHQGYMRCWDMSFSLPLDGASRALRRVVAYAERARGDGEFPVNMAVYARFTGASNGFLAANHGRESCFVEVVSAHGTPRVEHHFARIADELLELPGARMHWGKH
ncbi:MAG: FAD-binding protein, partial [Myxococcales bacterium]|nr:FAD-binding protein [Myxococcales bacterium]